MTKGKRFHVLDSFRGISALCVVMFHLHVSGTVTELAFFRSAHLLVDFFFVLSGFVIAHGYDTGDGFSFKRFLVSRSFRLFPLHVAVLGVFLLLELGKLAAYRYGYDYGKVPFTGTTAPRETLPNLLLLQSWVPSLDSLSFNWPSWSISVEYYIYLLFALLMPVGRRVRYAIWLVLAVGALAGIQSGQGLLPYEVLRGLFCFFSGALTYRLYLVVRPRLGARPGLFSVAEVTALLVAVAVLSLDVPDKDLLVRLLSCALVLLFALEGGALSSILKHRVFLHLGRLSFSIYLTHACVLVCTSAVFMLLGGVLGVELAVRAGGEIHLSVHNALLNNLLVFLVLGVVLGVSAVTYRYVEVTGQKMGKRWLARTGDAGAGAIRFPAGRS